MEKEFVSYKQAVALKELGAGFPYIAWYLPNNPILILHPASMTTTDISAPLKQQVFRWFREKGYSFNIMADNAILNSNYFYDIWYNTKFMIETDYDYSTYEEAENACIDKLIELTKTK